MSHRISGAIALALFACAAQARTVKVSDFGFDAEDSTRFLQAALDSGADKVIVDKRPEGPWMSLPLRGRSDTKLVFEEGVELVAKRGAYQRVTDTLLTFANASNVTIRGKGRLRMWRSDYQQPPYARGEWRHALAILACRNVLVKDLEIVESGGDGIYLSTVRPTKPGFREYSERVAILNVKCLRNHRQGISVIAGDQVLIEGCELSDTCGTSPQAGIDFEPNVPGDTIARCTLRNCLLERNKGYGVDGLFTWHDELTAPLDITIENCISRDNQKAFHFNGLQQNGNLRTNPGRIVVTNCVAREKGAADAPYALTLAWGAANRLPDGRALLPLKADEWDPSQVEVTDRRPGELLALSPARYRHHVEYLFYAAQAGELVFGAHQLPVGAKAKPSEAKLKLTTWSGEAIAELSAPGLSETIYRPSVPQAGFYRLSWSCGWASSIILDKSAAPVAVSLFARREANGRWMSPFMYGQVPTKLFFPVPRGNGPFIACASGVGGATGQYARMQLYDPSGKRVCDQDNVGYGWSHVSEPQPMAGLWTLVIEKPSNGKVNNYGADILGLPPLFFLSPDRYWTKR